MSVDPRDVIRRTQITRRRTLQMTVGVGTGLMMGAAGFAARALAASDMKGTVTVFTSAGQRWELPERGVLPLFQKAFPNIEVNLRPIPHGEANPKIQVMMRAKSDAFDVIFGEYGQWPAMSAMGALTDLTPFLAKDPAWRDDYFSDVPEPVSSLYRVPANPNGTTYGLTPDGNAQVTFYRADIFEKKGIKVPETWPEAIDAAKELNDPANGVYGFITTMRRGLYAGWEFWAVHASYGGTWFDKEEKGGWNPAFNNDAGHQALETLVKLMEYAHPVTLNAIDDEVNAALANGSAVYAPIEWGTPLLNDPSFTKFSDVIKADLTPRGETANGAHKPLMGGLGMFIPTWSKNKDAAFEWVKWCCSGNKTDPAIGKAWVENKGQPARVSLLTEYSKQRAFFAGLAKAFPKAIPFVSLIPESFPISEILGNETTEVLTGGKTIDAALKSMDKSVHKLMQDSGYYK